MLWDVKFKIQRLYGTQRGFADALKVHESLVSAVVRGRRKLPAGEQERWGRALRCGRGVFVESGQRSERLPEIMDSATEKIGRPGNAGKDSSSEWAQDRQP